MPREHEALPQNHDLDRLLRESAEAVKRMTLEQRQSMHEAQCKSWVIGELMLAHPEMSREEAERIYERAKP